MKQVERDSELHKSLPSKGNVFSQHAMLRDRIDSVKQKARIEIELVTKATIVLNY